MKVLERGAEGSTAVAHSGNPGVFFILTVEGMRNGIFGNTVAMAHRNAEQQITNAAFNRVKLDTIIKDPGSNVNIAEGFYLAPAEGYYHAEGQVGFGATAVINAVFIASIGVNGAEQNRGVRMQQASAVAAANNVTVSAIVFCAKGDKIELLAFQNTGGEVGLPTAAFANYLHVVRVA